MQQQLTRLFRTRRSGTSIGAIVAAAAAGAAITSGAFLLFGPGGRRRRALTADRVDHWRHKAADELDKASRDLRQHAHGVAARAHARSRARHGEGAGADADDIVVTERVRAALGHVCSHPHAVATSVQDGVLLLQGAILSAERARVIKELTKVPGVRDVVDDMEAHADATGVPALQGGRERALPLARAAAGADGAWSPGARLVAGAAGAGLVACALADRRALGLAGGALGALLLARAVTNHSGGARSGRGPFAIKKSMFIDADIDTVFDVFRKVEQFPSFMTHVRSVERIDDDHYEWRVDGPFGAMTSLCELTRWLPNEGIAWKTVDDGPVHMAGELRFHEEDGGTRLDIELSYRPVAGAAGFAVARALHRDPKHLLDDDMLRLKSLLENGKATGKRGQVSRDDLT